MKEEITLAWMAGILDGEGALQIKRYRRGEKVYYQLWVVVGMADIPQNHVALEMFHQMFGGYRTFAERNDGRRKDLISWTVVSQKALACLRQVLPYLVIKRDQAELLIEFQSKFITKKRPKSDPTRREAQEVFFYRMRKLHSKGNLRLQRLSERTPQGDATV